MQIVHFIVYGLILGWAGAVPIGPINLEIMRINLSKGLRYGMVFGLSSCLADITYLAIFASGLAAFLDFERFIRVVALGGAAVLCFFAFMTFKGLAKTRKVNQEKQEILREERISSKPLVIAADQSGTLWRYGLAGFSLTMVNPFTVLFWVSISTQAATVSERASSGIFWVGLGVLLGTTSWAAFLNIVLHKTRHKISQRWMNRLTFSGALLLVAFAAYTLIHFM